VWSWWREGSIHRAPWPESAEIDAMVNDDTDSARLSDQTAYDFATDVLFEVRKQRSEAKQPLKIPITKVSVKAERARLDRAPALEADLRSALRVQAFAWSVGEPPEIIVEGYEPPAS
jgi:valyl-tRNA synthetase